MTVEHPSAEDYIKAVQRPDVVFDRPELVAARFDVHPLLGIPVPASGTTAVVFKARVGGTDQALRFFTRDDAATRARYTALNTWFTEHGLTGDVAACRWIDDAVLVNGHRWPMVQMEWVEGMTLDRHVEQLVEDGDRQGLEALAGSWRSLVARAQAARFAHGDLQHGNVLVDGSGAPRLVDFDSSWIAPFDGSRPPTEGGHRNYQPANRVWGAWMDTFPGLVIYLSLLALARDPQQWEPLNDGENLLFRDRDYLPPHRTEAWTRLTALGDPEVDQLTGRLRACCRPGWTATGDLESLLREPTPWWSKTDIGTSSIPSAGGGAPARGSAPVRPRGPAGPAPGPAGPGDRRWPTRAGAGDPAGSPPAAGPGRGPRPGARPPAGGQSTWWTRTSGPQPAAPQPLQPARPPTPSTGGIGRTVLGVLRGVGSALLVLFTLAVAQALIAAVLRDMPGLSTQQESTTSLLLALIPAAIVFILLVVRRRRR